MWCLPKKEVVHFERQIDNQHKGLLSLMVEEEEVLRMSSALVDAILTETAQLYMVKYPPDPPNKQEAAKISYPVNRSVLSVLEQNPNLLTMPDLGTLTANRYLLDNALKELLDEDDEWFSIFTAENFDQDGEASEGLEGQGADGSSTDQVGSENQDKSASIESSSSNDSGQMSTSASSNSEAQSDSASNNDNSSSSMSGF